MSLDIINIVYCIAQSVLIGSSLNLNFADEVCVCGGGGGVGRRGMDILGVMPSRLMNVIDIE